MRFMVRSRSSNRANSSRSLFLLPFSDQDSGFPWSPHLARGMIGRRPNMSCSGPKPEAR